MSVLKIFRQHKHHDVVIVLDHNFDLLKVGSNTPTQDFLDLNLEHNFVPTITKPTRATKTSTMLLHNIFLSSKLQYNYKSFILLDELSDHYPCLVVLGNVNKCNKEKVAKKETSVNLR